MIFNTAAHIGTAQLGHRADSASDVTIACNNLAFLTGNFGRPGGGVLTSRGPANYQGVTDMGASPDLLPGGESVSNDMARQRFEAAWLGYWAERARTRNGFVPVRSLPATQGKNLDQMIAAIEAGEITAMYVEGTIAGKEVAINPRLLAALEKLEFLVVADLFDSPLAKIADFVLPLASSLEKDGSFTSLDRTVQRVRATIPALGEAKSSLEIMTMLANRMGFDIPARPAGSVMTEISSLVESYGGVNYARLERAGLSAPVTSFVDPGSPILTTGVDGYASINPNFIPVAH